MSTEKKYYRTIFRIEVLSDAPLSNELTLEDINYEITDGHCSGMFLDAIAVELTEDQMREALIRQGSDPSFLIEDETETAETVCSNCNWVIELEEGVFSVPEKCPNCGSDL